MLLQSGACGARTLLDKAVHNPVALISQAPVKAFVTITASGFGHPKANTLPWPLRSVHRLHTLQCPVRRHRILEPATFGPQDPLEPAVISLDHIVQGVSPAGELLSSTAYARRSVP